MFRLKDYPAISLAAYLTVPLEFLLAYAFGFSFSKFFNSIPYACLTLGVIFCASTLSAFLMRSAEQTDFRQGFFWGAVPNAVPLCLFGLFAFFIRLVVSISMGGYFLTAFALAAAATVAGAFIGAALPDMISRHRAASPRAK